MENIKLSELSGLERFGGIDSKLEDFYMGKCNENDLKNELELMIIIGHRMLKIPTELMDYIKELNEIIGPYHWNEEIEEKTKYICVRLNYSDASI